MSNFEFLKEEWPVLYKFSKVAEELCYYYPDNSIENSNKCLEQGTKFLCEAENFIEDPQNKTQYVLMKLDKFISLMDMNRNMLNEVHLIRTTANSIKHKAKFCSADESLTILKNVFRFLSFIATSYGKKEISIPKFNEELISKIKTDKDYINKYKEELEKKNREELKKAKEKHQNQIIEEKEKRIKDLEYLLANSEKPIRGREQKEVIRRKNLGVNYIPELVSESKTIEMFISIYLEESGWDSSNTYNEYQVDHMPESVNRTGIGFADFVLTGKDGKPLAVIEVKKVSKKSRVGRHQAVLYADSLEKMHGQRPIIYYTNGFETFIWDDKFSSSERKITGFHTQDELQLLIDRRQIRKDLRNFHVNRDISGRDYQLEAIKRVAENFVINNKDGKLIENKRKSLLVMATGSGKTRTSAGIVDMLTKCNWAKRILFLADRNALVTQAKNAFNEHLPELSSIDLTKEKEDSRTRLVFSTYPTIINKIDREKENKKKTYGVGHFDLIIIDEAHRSVYHKYRAIFDYFDSLLIGLTATPKKDIDRNTYSLFDIEDDNPTFAYELEKAVEQGYLVPPKSISVPLKFQREGIKYDELSEDEKDEFEEIFGDPTNDEIPEYIGNAAINRWLFNTDTVDKVLNHVMKDGIKVNGGDKLGKTIIFAKNHDHAVFIENRFNKNYPEYGGTFLRVIDNYETKAQDLLERFTDNQQENDPQIAVSVDMMDTGVDAPRVVNLVFFKMVKSLAKFWQMIGRGTRLCPNLFGPNQDKKEFMIFDYCQNFEFFEEFPEGTVNKSVKPLTQQIFEAKLTVSQLINKKSNKSTDEEKIRDKYINELYSSVKNLDDSRFIVRQHLRYVKEFSNKDRWLNLSENDIDKIKKHLSNLEPVKKNDDELARRFDILNLMLQICILSGSGDSNIYIGKIYMTASSLQKKDTIPEVSLKIPFIKEIQTDKFWQKININQIEMIRINLRDLIKYLESKNQEPVYTNFEDNLDYEGIEEIDSNVNATISLESYKNKVENYIRKNRDHVTIHKLSNNIPISREDLNKLEEILFTDSVAGTKSDFIREYGDRPLGKFIRNIIGLEREALNEAFSDFLQVGNLRADQMTFISTIISYLSNNGVIDKRMLFEQPFTNLDDNGIVGIFKDESKVKSIVRIIDKINENAEVS